MELGKIDNKEILKNLLAASIDVIFENYLYPLDCDELYNSAMHGIFKILDQYSFFTERQSLNEPYIFTQNRENESITQAYRDSEAITLVYSPIKNEINKSFYFKTKVIKIFEISEKAYLKLKDFLNDAKINGIDRIIIDLSENHGGDPEYTLKIINLLVRKKLLFYYKNKEGIKSEVFSTLVERPFNTIFVVVSNNTKSAAELIAFALKQDDNVIIGEKTFGKAVTQKYYNIFGGRKMSLTINEYFDENDNRMNGVGIEPDFIVSSIDNNYEVVLKIMHHKSL